MALSQKHRAALYDHFAPLVGEEVSEALLAEFPADDGGGHATKADLHALRSDLQSSEAVLRAELGSGISDLRAELHQLHNRTITILLGGMAVMTAVLAQVN